MAFNLARGLCGRSMSLYQLNALRSPIATHLTGARCVSLKVIPSVTDNASYEDKNAKLKREMSPHLTIYKPQLTSMLSITHRFTGMALTGYAAAIGLGALVLPHDFQFYITMIEGLKLSAPTLAILKFYIAFPATYHTCNGVRHLFWDMGKFLKLNEVYTTGWIMLGTATALAAILSVI